MTQTLLTSFAAKGKPPDKPDLHDDDTVATPPKGQKTKKHEQEFTKKVVYLTSDMKTNNDKANFRFHHVELLQTLQTEFPAIRLYDNKENEINDLAWTKWSDPLSYMTHFKIYQKSTRLQDKTVRSTKAIVCHRIESSESMTTIRNNQNVAAVLRKHNLYIRQHNWEPNEWDTVPMGILVGVNPYTYSPTDTMIKLNTFMKRAQVKSTIKYQVYRNKTQIKVNNDNRVFTQAYVIEVKREDTLQARKELQQTFHGSKQFAFLALKYKHPHAFANALKSQNRYLSESHTITIKNIPESAAKPITQQLMKHQPKIVDIIQHTRDKHQGKYLVLTTKTSAQEVSEYLQNHLKQLTQQIPRASTDSQFDHPPEVVTINGAVNAEEDSSGTKSWYSNSASTFATDEYGDEEYTTCENFDHKSTSHTKFAYYNTSKSYAAATVTPTETSYTSSITPDEAAEIASIRALVSQYQLDLDRKDKEYQAALAEERKRREEEQEQAQQRHAALQKQIEQLMAMVAVSIHQDSTIPIENTQDSNSSTSKRQHTMEHESHEPTSTDESPWKKVNSRSTPKKHKPKIPETLQDKIT
jgi:hypothetical protein